MRGFASGVAAGALIMAATTLIASPAVLDLAGARAGQGAVIQLDRTQMQRVDRTGKGDRLDAHRTLLRQQGLERKPEQILTGCEPVISPLSISASAGNFPRRCVAQLDGLFSAG